MRRDILTESNPYVLSEVGRADFWSSAIGAYCRLIPRAGVLGEEEANAWAAALRRDSEDGVFFGSSNSTLTWPGVRSHCGATSSDVSPGKS